MTQTFSANDDNDIFIGGDGNLAIASGLEATLLACESATKAQLGEMILATGLGIPNFQAIWVGVPNYAIYRSYLVRTILSVDGVQSIESLELTPQDDTLQYTIVIKTIFGTGQING
jgi:hypothetical protein